MQWTLDDALPLIRKIMPIAHQNGLDVALRGGVLRNGYSEKDLDLFFTFETEKTAIAHIQNCLNEIAKLPEIRVCGKVEGGSRPYCVIWLKDGRYIDAQFELLDF
jgi:hypothetical protein